MSVAVRQVIPDGDGWKLANEEKAVSSMQWRYFLRVSFMDESGSSEILLSNDQVSALACNLQRSDVICITFISKLVSSVFSSLCTRTISAVHSLRSGLCCICNN